MSCRRHPWLLGPIAALAIACNPAPSSEGEGETSSTSSEAEESESVGSTSETETETESETETGPGDPDLPEPPVLPEPMVVMTFNILCSFCDPSYDPWDERVAYISDTIARHAPDLIGMQELFTGDEVQQLRDLNPGYEVLFYTDDLTDYADASIWYRPDRYEVVDSGYYWLSPAPDTPFSVGFAPMQFPRLVAWARLMELSTEAELLFATTHFDNNSPSQELSAPLLLERTEAELEAGGEVPVIVVGDFNSRPDSEAYMILVEGVGGLALSNSFDLADTWSIDSNQMPAPDYDVSQRIDHIFVAAAEWSVPWWIVDTWVYGASDLHTSDHFAMVAELAPG